MKKFRAIITSVFTALTLLCVSAVNTFAATLGKSVLNDGKNVVATGDESKTLIIIISAVAIVALVVIIISIVASKNKKK